MITSISDSPPHQAEHAKLETEFQLEILALEKKVSEQGPTVSQPSLSPLRISPPTPRPLIPPRPPNPNAPGFCLALGWARYGLSSPLNQSPRPTGKR